MVETEEAKIAAQSAAKKVKIRIENLSLSFGGVKALTDVSIVIKEREILAIIGPNGAGKTCVLNCINGFYKPQKGEIYFAERRITRIRPDRAAKMGLECKSCANTLRYSPNRLTIER